MKYKVTIVVTDIYDVEIEADTLAEAQELALADSTRWVLDESASTTELGGDHWVQDTETKKWVSAV
jgi:hypothetical protein